MTFIHSFIHSYIYAVIYPFLPVLEGNENCNNSNKDTNCSKHTLQTYVKIKLISFNPRFKVDRKKLKTLSKIYAILALISATVCLVKIFYFLSKLSKLSCL